MKKGKSRFWIFLGMLVGAVSIVVGIIFLANNASHTFYDETFSSISHLKGITFGADFYSEVYKAAAFAGNAVAKTYKLLINCFGVLFILIGAIDFCAFGSKLVKKEGSSETMDNIAPSQSKYGSEKEEPQKIDKAETASEESDREVQI